MRKDLGIVRKLSKLYIAALTAIALLVVSGELLMQRVLERQTGDSRVVNIAGRQRMLSQKLSKEAVLIQQAKTSAERERWGLLLAGTVELWQKSYLGLLQGDSEAGLSGTNSEKVLGMFRAIEKPFGMIRAAAEEILQIVQDREKAFQGEKRMRKAVAIILRQDPQFLKGMDQIVFQYDQEARLRIELSKRIEWLILWAALFVLVLEGLFIFRPAVRRLSKTLIHLKKEQWRTQRLAGQLQTQNQKLDQAFTEILDISEQERRRIAQDLHDGLAQELSGITCMTKALQRKVEGRSSEDFLALQEVNRLISEAMQHTREIARGLYPMTVNGDGLLDKLKDLSVHIEKAFHVRCRLTSPAQLLGISQQHATHLYCITQEAIHNSIRHGKAKAIDVSVCEKSQFFSISIADDGMGFAPDSAKDKGLGLRIMKYRSELIHGQLNVLRNELGGVTVTCEVQRKFQ